MKKHTPCKWQPQESRDDHAYIRQNRPSKKLSQETQIRALYYDKRLNLPGRLLTHTYKPNIREPKNTKQTLAEQGIK